MRARVALYAALLPVFVIPAATAAAQRETRPPADELDPVQLVGMSVSTSGSERDTLGMWISEVVPGGPADRARIQQGDRLAEVNGMSLRISPEDVGRREAEELVARRFARELQRVRRGDNVSMRIYASGELRSVTISTRRTVDRVPRRLPPVGDEEMDHRVDERTSSVTLDDIIAALRATSEQIRQLGENADRGMLRDSLADAERELVMLQRRMREWQADKQDREPRGREARDESLRGLRVTVVGEELASYFGDESARGLLVLEASDLWSPIRAGDVIVRIDDEPASVEALRTVLDARRSVTVEVLRRKRLMLVTLRPDR